MSAVIDMSTPVTRGELRDELALFEARIERKFDDKLDNLERKIDAKLDNLERRFDGKLDNLEHKIDGKLDNLERRLNNNMGLWGEALATQIKESEKRLSSELARHMQAGFEAMTAQIASFDDKYKDLPARVTRLEADVEALK